MLNGFGDKLLPTKRKDLSRRLEHTDTETALAAEAELGVLWAISRVANVDLEPEIEKTGRKPDAFSDDFLASGPAVIEIAAISDRTFSGKEAMQRTASIICETANKIRKGCGQHLHFEFANNSSLKNGSMARERMVDPAFQVSAEIHELLRSWMTEPGWPEAQPTLNIAKGKTDVTISFSKNILKANRVFTEMPAVTYDLEKNPLYSALQKKAKQVKGHHLARRSVIFLCDMGSDILNRASSAAYTQEKTAKQIVRHAMRKLKLDIVCLVSANKLAPIQIGGPVRWNLLVFDSQNQPEDFKRFEELATLFPPTRFEGYKAAQLHRLGRFDPDKNGCYLPTYVKMKGSWSVEIKISTSLLQQYMLGKIAFEEFRKELFQDSPELLTQVLKDGLSIQGARIEPTGLDHDDDYVVFDLRPDWAAKRVV